MDPAPSAKATCPGAAAPAGTRVLVLGGCGFIGRHAVSALLARGGAVTLGSRHPERRGTKAAPLPCLHTRFEDLLQPEPWQALVAGSDVVLNCVGILRQRGRETYDRVHHLAPAALAEACRRQGVRLVHVSALGLDASARSRFLRSKRDGEAALRASGADYRIVRPSLLDAEGDGFGARWVRRVARWPLHPLPASATGRIAALHVDDLAEALARLALEPESAGDAREIELGGADERTLAGLLAALRRVETARPARLLALPHWLARLGSHACDLLHFSPFSFGHLELLQRDNRPQHNALPGILGRPARRIGSDHAPALPAPALPAAPAPGAGIA